MSGDAEAGGDKAAGKGGRKKLILAGAAVLLLGAGAGGWFSGVIPRLLGRGGETAAAEGGGHGAAPGGHGAPAQAAGHGGGNGGGHGDKAEAKAENRPDRGATTFMDLPDIVANLNGGPRRAVFVKLKAKLELSRPEDQATLTAAMPRVLDLFQSYLREMRPEELRGTAGTYRLREELLARTNLAAPPARVVAVLFTELLVQ